MNWADQDYSIGRGLAALRHKRGLEFQPYLKALLETLLPDLLGSATGSTFPNVSRDQLAKAKIFLHSLDQQLAISRILNSLDSKIELNRQMCKTLEDIASALFKSWFIDFDPVKAKAAGREPEGLSPEIAGMFPDSFVDSPLGKIPKGWEQVTLREVAANFDSKRIPLSNREREKRRGIYPYHGATGILDYLDDYIFDGIYLLLGEDGSVVKEDATPFTQYVQGKFWVNNHAHVLQGINSISTEHLYLFIKQVNISPFITGAVQPKLNQKNMYSIPFLKANMQVCQYFNEITTSIFKRIHFLRLENESLGKIRNYLIPKLINGSIKVNGLNE